MWRLFFLGALTALALQFSMLSAHAQPSRGDADGDGLDDVAVALVDRSARSTAWLTRLSSGAAPLFYVFNVPGDALVQGRFFAENRSFPGVVHVRDASRPLEWYIKAPGGSQVALHYGLPGDTIPNLGDMDCDGITDIIVVRNGRPGYYDGYKLWYVALSSAPGVIQEMLFGLAADRVYTGDVNGNGCDDMIALRDGFYWFSRDLFGFDMSVVQWGLPGDLPLLPRDLNGDGQADYIISRPSGGGQVGYVRYGADSSTTLALGADGSLPLVGRFSGPNSFAVWNRSQGTLMFRQGDGSFSSAGFGITTNALVRPDGTVIQPTDDGRFGGTGGGSGGGGGGGVAPGSCSTPKFPDGSGGTLWKPHREGGGSCQGGACPTYLTSNSAKRVEILGQDGAVVEEVRLRYYNGNGGRSVWDPRRSASYYSQFAPLTVRTHFSGGACQDRAVPDPTKRYD